MVHAIPDPDDVEAELKLRAEIDARIAALDLAAEFRAAGQPYSELDENGKVVTRNLPPGSP